MTLSDTFSVYLRCVPTKDAQKRKRFRSSIASLKRSLQREPLLSDLNDEALHEMASEDARYLLKLWRFAYHMEFVDRPANSHGKGVRS